MTKKFIKSIALALFVAVILPFAANASAAEPDILCFSNGYGYWRSYLF